MHIAICDDNVADRKQLERLLSRESDKRKENSGLFYTDSFGLGSELMSKRQSYDLFFIDIVEESENGLEFALTLCDEGVTVPIVLCSSKHDYKSQAAKLPNYPKNLLFLNKPIIKAELSAVLDEAVILAADREPTIELRHNKETYYVLEDDIVYVSFDKEYATVFLKDGTEVPLLMSSRGFLEELRQYTHFAFINNKTIINAFYLKSYSPIKATLKSGLSFRLDLRGRKSLLTALKYLKEEGFKEEI